MYVHQLAARNLTRRTKPNHIVLFKSKENLKLIDNSDCRKETYLGFSEIKLAPAFQSAKGWEGDREASTGSFFFLFSPHNEYWKIEAKESADSIIISVNYQIGNPTLPDLTVGT